MDEGERESKERLRQAYRLMLMARRLERRTNALAVIAFLGVTLVVVLAAWWWGLIALAYSAVAYIWLLRSLQRATERGWWSAWMLAVSVIGEAGDGEMIQQMLHAAEERERGLDFDQIERRLHELDRELG